jgi:hypothetical protein
VNIFQDVEIGVIGPTGSLMDPVGPQPPIKPFCDKLRLSLWRSFHKNMIAFFKDLRHNQLVMPTLLLRLLVPVYFDPVLSPLLNPLEHGHAVIF